MDARSLAAVSGRARRPLRALLILPVALLLAACTGTAASPGASPSPTPVPSTLPAATASPVPSAAAATPAAVAYPVTLTDDEGTEVTIPSEPRRIVSLTPAVTETLFALGVGDRIVGKSQDILLYPPEAASIPDVVAFDGTGMAVDVEQILASGADLAIAGGNFGTPPDAVAKLRDLGVPVVVVYAPDVETVFRDIELIGSAVGRSAEGAALAGRMRDEFAAVAAAVAGAPRPRVFYEIDATGAYYGPADQSFLAEMISLAGGDPVTTGSPDKYDISAERLLEADPEVILLGDAAYGMTPEQVAARPGWDAVTAVKDGAVRPIDDTTITRPGPRLFLGLQLLASAIHPDLPIPSSSPVPPVP